MGSLSFFPLPPLPIGRRVVSPTGVVSAGGRGAHNGDAVVKSHGVDDAGSGWPLHGEDVDLAYRGRCWACTSGGIKFFTSLLLTSPPTIPTMLKIFNPKAAHIFDIEFILGISGIRSAKRAYATGVFGGGFTFFEPVEPCSNAPTSLRWALYCQLAPANFKF